MCLLFVIIVNVNFLHCVLIDCDRTAYAYNGMNPVFAKGLSPKIKVVVAICIGL